MGRRGTRSSWATRHMPCSESASSCRRRPIWSVPIMAESSAEDSRCVCRTWGPVCFRSARAIITSTRVGRSAPRRAGGLGYSLQGGRRRREARRQISALAAGHLPIAIARCPEEVRGECRPSLRSGKAHKPTPPRQQRPHGIVIDLNGPCSSGHPLFIPAPAPACAASQNFPSCPR